MIFCSYEDTAQPASSPQTRQDKHTMFSFRTATASLVALLAATNSVNGAALNRRTPVIESIIPFSIVPEPAAGTSAAAGDTFPLSYNTPFFGECPSSLYALEMFLLDHVPTAADVTTVPPNTTPDIIDPLFQFGQGWLGWIGSKSLIYALCSRERVLTETPCVCRQQSTQHPHSSPSSVKPHNARPWHPEYDALFLDHAVHEYLPCESYKRFQLIRRLI